MNCVESVMNRGRSCFNALLMYSYSLVASSKSCSSWVDEDKMTGYPRATLGCYLEQILLVAQRFFLLVSQFGKGIVKSVVVGELFEVIIRSRILS